MIGSSAFGPFKFEHGASSSAMSWIGAASTANSSAICPDLLRHEQLGEADGFRGRLVRAFFWVLWRIGL